MSAPVETVAAEPTRNPSVFHGMLVSDLRSLAEIQTWGSGNTVTRQATPNRHELPFPVGTVLFQANSPLVDGQNHIRSVGVVLEGKAKSTKVMILEKSWASPDHPGRVVMYDHLEIWRGRLIDYVMTPEQRSQFAKAQEDMKTEASKKRKEQQLAREAKKAKPQN
jgi:hypothetical protein